MLKNLTANAGDEETWILSLGWEDPLEEGMPTHSRILPRESHGQRSMTELQPVGSQRVEHD